jgi:hypothetical protein
MKTANLKKGDLISPDGVTVYKLAAPAEGGNPNEWLVRDLDDPSKALITAVFTRTGPQTFSMERK